MIRPQCDLLESQHMNVEFLLHCPFFVHQVGRKWVLTTFTIFAPVPFSQLYMRIPQKATLNNRRAVNNRILSHRICFIPILSRKIISISINLSNLLEYYFCYNCPFSELSCDGRGRILQYLHKGLCCRNKNNR